MRAGRHVVPSLVVDDAEDVVASREAFDMQAARKARTMQEVGERGVDRIVRAARLRCRVVHGRHAVSVSCGEERRAPKVARARDMAGDLARQRSTEYVRAAPLRPLPLREPLRLAGALE